MKRCLVAVIAAATLLVPAALAQAFVSNNFQSPTGNIRCRYSPGQSNTACQTLNDNVVATITLFGDPFTDVISGRIAGGPVLRYGAFYTVRNRFRCSSRSDGMRCWSLRTGRGFFINRTSYRPIFVNV